MKFSVGSLCVAEKCVHPGEGKGRAVKKHARAGAKLPHLCKGEAEFKNKPTNPYVKTPSSSKSQCRSLGRKPKACMRQMWSSSGACQNGEGPPDCSHSQPSPMFLSQLGVLSWGKMEAALVSAVQDARFSSRV